MEFALIAIEDEGQRYNIASWGGVGERHHMDGSEYVCGNAAAFHHSFCGRNSSGYWEVQTRVFASLS